MFRANSRREMPCFESNRSTNVIGGNPERSVGKKSRNDRANATTRSSESASSRTGVGLIVASAATLEDRDSIPISTILRLFSSIRSARSRSNSFIFKRACFGVRRVIREYLRQILHAAPSLYVRLFIRPTIRPVLHSCEKINILLYIVRVRVHERMKI